MDAALTALYGGVKSDGGKRNDGRGKGDRTAGLGASAPSVARWLGDIRTYFPTSVVRIMQRDAMDRLGLGALLLEPELLEAVEADVHLVGTLLSLNKAMPETTRETARTVVRKVVEDLERRLASRTRATLTGALDRSARTSRPRHRDIDWDRTIRANLKNYVTLPPRAQEAQEAPSPPDHADAHDHAETHDHAQTADHMQPPEHTETPERPTPLDRAEPPDHAGPPGHAEPPERAGNPGTPSAPDAPRPRTAPRPHTALQAHTALHPRTAPAGTVVPERLVGHGRAAAAVRKEVILCVDQSGSMAASVVHASVFGAVLGSMRTLDTRLVVFDTAVVDLTDELDDPVDVLFGVQLGGGTDIARALAYCQSRITRPADTVLVLISDLYEGGVRDRMIERVAAMKASGVQCVVLLALSDDGEPAYDREHAAALAALGVPAFACTPDRFPEVMAAALEKRPLPLPEREPGAAATRR
ncbi:VWA domain-containing protein [uncultured Streptomyces sp.]|uniref:VWA domain-containing protein n=1 Tax=uncultured Streptomyces sp. TaxID=174707 RepID=UPI00262B41F7|nr:VWA domain-containing protein [uncultured Streptomyces sp.]